MDMNKRLEHVAELTILYWEMPRRPGDRFVEIRRWETADGTTSELIVETGRLMADGDLQTRCQVMPFYMTVREALAAMAI